MKIRLIALCMVGLNPVLNMKDNNYKVLAYDLNEQQKVAASMRKEYGSHAMYTI